MNQTTTKPDKNHENTTYKHVIKYTGVFGGVQGLKLLSSVARNKLTTCLLGSVGLGMISVYNSISEFSANCSNFGLPLNITRDASELHASEDEQKIIQFACVTRTWALWTALLGALFTFILSPLFSYYFFDNDAGRYFEVIALIPIVVSLIIAEAECSLLKGLRRLRRVAIVETICAVTTLLFTIPFYYFLGLEGIVFGLTVSTIVACLVHVFFTTSIIPYQIKPLSIKVFKDGWPLVRRGIPYVIAGIGNTGARLLVNVVILTYGTFNELGLYQAGYMLMVSYAALIFKALDSEYYPRLSSVNQSREKVNTVVNQQIEVCVHLVTPFLILFVLCMPVIIPLLFKSDFLVILNMTMCAAYYTFFRAIILPVSYTALAKGDSIVFLIIEIISSLIFLSVIFYLYPRYGLLGAGISLSLASLFDMIFNLTICKWRYGSEIFYKTICDCFVQFIILTVSLIICFFFPLTTYSLIVIILLLLSACYSYRRLVVRSRNVL